MSAVRSAVRAGSYYDSVVLMQLQKSLAALPGVRDAGVAMATPANLEMLAASGLLAPEARAAAPSDLVIAVEAESEEAAAEALARVDALLAVRQAAGNDAGFRPRSLAGALRELPEARWVLVSVPGRHAAAVAEEALDAGRHVFLYSDNVPLADEVALKQKAAARGLLVLGPDCGTAILGGVGFGFANRVRPGRIGVVAASGTGLQAVASRIHELGEGLSQAIGTGGRDFKGEVGGATTLQALDLLGRDPETQAVVLLGKPPAPAVAAELLAAARGIGKPVVVNFLGFAPPLRQVGEIHFAVSLGEAAERAVELVRSPRPSAVSKSARSGASCVRGLFSGGTLAYEAQLGLQSFLAPLFSNTPVGAILPLADPAHSQGHTILDLGADEFTVGRLHPMIDPDLRLRRLRQEAADPEVGALLLDVVLGEGTHADPAGLLAPAIEEARAAAAAAGRELAVLALLVGTELDPQNLEEQAATLAKAGAVVVRSVEAAVAATLEAIGPRPPLPPAGEGTGVRAPVDLAALRPPVAVNVGVESFYQSLVAQGTTAIQVDWRPPAGGNEKLAALLARMR